MSRKSYIDSEGGDAEGKVISIRGDINYDKDIKRKGKTIYIDDKLYKTYENMNKAKREFNNLIRKQKLLLKDE